MTARPTVDAAVPIHVPATTARARADRSGAPSGIWRLSVRGRAVELVHPSLAEVDLAEIAEEMAGIYRWCGAAPGLDVSVGLHTLIGLDACPAGLEPWWLLHDAHEARIGDITTPVAVALAALGGPGVAEAIRTLKLRHDLVIHRAAGLALPSEDQARALKRIDRIALVTERRDFLRDSPLVFWTDADPSGAAAPAEPLRRRCRWAPKPDVADRLWTCFRKHLPALAGR